MSVAVLETGGTINGIVDPAAPAPTESAVVAWLERHSERLQLQVSARLVVMKDSRALNETDRSALATAITACPLQRILVPHGTYTMPETGVYLRNHLSDRVQQKTIVLVGSIIPLDEPASDAPAALEFALRTLSWGKGGVWVAMNGRAWHPGKVVKHPVSGEFVPR